MNLKSNLIFTLYTIYGILLKGEPGTSGCVRARCMCVCALCLCVCVCVCCLRAHVAGQQQGRVKRQNAQKGAELSLSQGLSSSRVRAFFSPCPYVR